MKRYTTDQKGIATFFIILTVLNALILYFNRNPAMSLSKIIVGLASWIAFMGFGILLMTMFSYVSISDTKLKFIWLLFSRRTIDIDSITDINDQSTFKVAKSQFRSLYIFYKNKSNDTKWIEFRITIFPEKTLGRLIKDLKSINPDIKLNNYAEKLMRSA